MACLDSSIVIIGLPTILDQLHASLFHGIWIITGLLADDDDITGDARPAGGFIRPVRLFNLGFCHFHYRFRCCCALSQNGQQLVLFRTLTGFRLRSIDLSTVSPL